MIGLAAFVVLLVAAFVFDRRRRKSGSGSFDPGPPCSKSSAAALEIRALPRNIVAKNREMFGAKAQSTQVPKGKSGGRLFKKKPKAVHSSSAASSMSMNSDREDLLERLLDETRGDLEESRALNDRMRGAWMVNEDSVRFGRKIAEGNYGFVKEGHYAGHKVAIKTLKRPLDDDDPEVALDFGRECETLMAIRHKNLLIFFGAGTTSENKAFMVTEFMALGSLKEVIADTTRHQLQWPIRIKIATHVASGMAHLHTLGIVHRDLKSANCLLNEALDAKVADFGTSKLVTVGRSKLINTETSLGKKGKGKKGKGKDKDSLHAPTATMTKGVGTPLWMAPELFVGGTKYGSEVDVWSFGMVMWELATRKVPWDDEIDTKVYIKFYGQLADALEAGKRPRVDVEVAQNNPGFVALLKECWAQKPESRPEFPAVVRLLGELKGGT